MTNLQRNTQSKSLKTRPWVTFAALLIIAVISFHMYMAAKGAPPRGDGPTTTTKTSNQQPKLAVDPTTNYDHFTALQNQYIETVKQTLTGSILRTASVKPADHTDNSQLVTMEYNEIQRESGLDWPQYGFSMAGVKRLTNIQELLIDVLDKNVPGDFVECGVWKGGASIFAKAVFFALGVKDRQVHLVDSFKGLPPSTTAEDTNVWSKMSFLMIPLADVKSNFQQFNLLDENTVFFHQGYFRYSLSLWRQQGLPKIAVLRMDGDMYESTIDQFYNLYDALSIGGYIIIDDWSIAVCQKAVNEFRDRHEIKESIVNIDQTAIYWKKEKEVVLDLDWYRNFNTTRSADDATRKRYERFYL